ncbi:hypothetical protein [Bradyrhizobium liaoningense]|uniref:hypothetical protein n=1 Tax=Bradyrhizobium TaxID=374 RepID=UPI002011565D
MTPISEEIAGAFVNNHHEMASHYDAGQQAFTTEDILWAVGIWSVILTLSPVIVFYMLMVA